MGLSWQVLKPATPLRRCPWLLRGRWHFALSQSCGWTLGRYLGGKPRRGGEDGVLRRDTSSLTSRSLRTQPKQGL